MQSPMRTGRDQIFIMTQTPEGFKKIPYNLPSLNDSPPPPPGYVYPNPIFNVSGVPHPEVDATSYKTPHAFQLRHNVSKYQIAKEIMCISKLLRIFKANVETIHRQVLEHLPIVSVINDGILSPSLYRQIRDIQCLMSQYVVCDHACGAFLAIIQDNIRDNGIHRTTRQRVLLWRQWIDVQRRLALKYASKFKGPKFHELWTKEVDARHAWVRLNTFWSTLQFIPGAQMHVKTVLPVAVLPSTFDALEQYCHQFETDRADVQARPGRNGWRNAGGVLRPTRPHRVDPATAAALQEIEDSIWEPMEPEFCEGQADLCTSWDPPGDPKTLDEGHKDESHLPDGFPYIHPDEDDAQYAFFTSSDARAVAVKAEDTPPPDRQDPRPFPPMEDFGPTEQFYNVTDRAYLAWWMKCEEGEDMSAYGGEHASPPYPRALYQTAWGGI